MKAIEMRRWTREDYNKMASAGLFTPGERVELVDGEILRMTPQGSVHATFIQLVYDELRLAFGPAFSIRMQLPVALSPDSEPEPDVAVVSGTALNYLHAHPATALLIVEVSDTTLEYDRRRKGSLYARAGIRDYWIVNLIDRCIEVHREPNQGAYGSCQRFFAGDAIAPLANLEAVIPLANIFRQE